MNILIAHNRYRLRAGEDKVFDQEVELLRANGHVVSEFVRDNMELSETGFGTGIKTIWSSETYRAMRRAIEETRPAIVHVHNTIPILSPSVYFAARSAGVPVVQTLHNYRLACAVGTFVRDGQLCEDCLGKSIGWPAIVHRCYRGSLGASTAVVTSTSLHRALGTWRNRIDTYITLTDYARSKMIEAGLPPEKIVVKPNFAPDRYGPADDRMGRSGGLYFGRLSEEKGIETLFSAWQGVDADLTVIGTGPLEDSLRSRKVLRVDMLGFVPQETLEQAIRKARFVVLPSTNFEGFPMVIAEAFSAATPIIASRLGSLAELVIDGETGLQFEPANADDLRSKIRWALEHPAEMDRMGVRGREVYEDRFTPDKVYDRLVKIYEATAARRSAKV